MTSYEEPEYRLKLARLYVEEAQKCSNISFGGVCAGSCQLAVENAAKSVISLFRLPVKTRTLADILLSLIESPEVSEEIIPKIQQLNANYLIFSLNDVLNV